VPETDKNAPVRFPEDRVSAMKKNKLRIKQQMTGIIGMPVSARIFVMIQSL
jgi:uncharacterized protein YdcH (DUF465 family)